MKNYGKQRSTVKPDEMVIDKNSVWIHSDIQEISEPGKHDLEGFTGYEFNMVQYDKDEFNILQMKKLQEQLSDTQAALHELCKVITERLVVD